MIWVGDVIPRSCPGVLTPRLDIVTARKLLGPNKIIGVTASSIEEADKAVQGGADYLGIGTVFATPT